MILRDRAVLLLATGASVGRIPWAPGTFGSLLGIPVAWGLADIGLGATAGILPALILGSVWIAGEAERLLGRRDAGCIVIDEIVGMFTALAGMPATLFNLAAGFVAFRVFDITKPFPARHIDARVPGGWGIVLDDVVAGIYSNLLLRIIALLY
jgi:phosphatidylglycerophosphatase A